MVPQAFDLYWRGGHLDIAANPVEVMPGAEQAALIFSGKMLQACGDLKWEKFPVSGFPAKLRGAAEHARKITEIETGYRLALRFYWDDSVCTTETRHEESP